MSRLKALVFSAAALFAVAAFAGAVLPASSAAEASAAANVVPPVAQDKGQIVFFRRSAYTGRTVTFTINEGGASIGRLSNGSYFVLDANPGAHSYSIARFRGEMNLDVQAGQTYYVEVRGLMSGHPELTPSNQTAFTANPLHLQADAGAAAH